MPKVFSGGVHQNFTNNASRWMMQIKAYQ